MALSRDTPARFAVSRPAPRLALLTTAPGECGRYDRNRPASYPNGRALTDDVFSARFAWLTNGKVTPDGPRPRVDLLADFPYPGPPNRYTAGWLIAIVARLASVVTESDIRLADGRTLHAYDTRADGIGADSGAADPAVAVFWLHGSPNVGSPPEPLFAAAAANGLRWVSYDRPGYGGSDPCDGRSVASAAADVAAIADALGIGRFAVLGHSGGGPHALGCAALLPERVIAAVSVSAPAPFDAAGLDWFAGWSPGIAAENRAAMGGRAALEAHWAQAEPEDMGAFFTEDDMAALNGSWSWLAGVAGQAIEQGGEGYLEDTLASVRPWGFRPDAIRVPALIMHGAKDKMTPCAHGAWLAAHCPAAESRIVPDAGHITVLDSAPEALAWLATRARA